VSGASAMMNLRLEWKNIYRHINRDACSLSALNHQLKGDQFTSQFILALLFNRL
jgi:hypothetical protein